MALLYHGFFLEILTENKIDQINNNNSKNSNNNNNNNNNINNNNQICIASFHLDHGAQQQQAMKNKYN